LTEWLCDLQSKTTRPANWDNDVVFWILQDWRNRHFRKPCPACGPNTGILLARVWLWLRKDSRGNDVFTTLFVNSYPPFRRILAHETWPARPGMLNLAQFVWARAEVAADALQRIGFTVQMQTVLSTNAVPALLRNEKLMVSAKADSTLSLYSYPDFCYQQRVVCFGSGPKPATAPSAPEELAADDPKLDLKEISGIGEASSAKLKAKNIRNIADLAKAKPEDVRAALADIKLNRPNEEAVIKSAQDYLEALRKGT
jgi:hypothetical protein